VPVHVIEPFKYLVHGEAWVLKPLPADRTRLIVRYQGMGFIAPAAAAIPPMPRRRPGHCTSRWRTSPERSWSLGGSTSSSSIPYTTKWSPGC
jgi:hypothetical protein